jgi:hypothetical protein
MPTATLNKPRLSSPSKKIDIGFTKTCSCKDNHLNCLTPKEWMKSQLGVWEFFYEKRDIRKKELHPATFPIALAKKANEASPQQAAGYHKEGHCL